MNDFDSRKAVLALCQYMIQNKLCDMAKLMREAPREKFDNMPVEQKIDTLVSVLDLKPLLKEMGLADYSSTNGSIPLDLFKWSRG